MLSMKFIVLKYTVEFSHFYYLQKLCNCHHLIPEYFHHQKENLYSTSSLIIFPVTALLDLHLQQPPTCHLPILDIQYTCIIHHVSWCVSIQFTHFQSPSIWQCVSVLHFVLRLNAFHCMHILHFTPTFNMRDKNQSHKEKKK